MENDHREYENIIRKQVQAARLEAEKDGVVVPLTLEDYCIKTKVKPPEHLIQTSFLVLSYVGKNDDNAEKNEFVNDLENEGNSMETELAASPLPKVYNLDNVVKVWADYLQTRYHPRTMSIINEYEHDSDAKPFDVFNCGSNIWKTEQFQEDFIDRIRIYVEECDNMQ
ncbi:hypothetical protein L9F63_001458, partial [Diploptera punctata]